MALLLWISTRGFDEQDLPASSGGPDYRLLLAIAGIVLLVVVSIAIGIRQKAPTGR